MGVWCVLNVLMLALLLLVSRVVYGEAYLFSLLLSDPDRTGPDSPPGSGIRARIRGGRDVEADAAALLAAKRERWDAEVVGGSDIDADISLQFTLKVSSERSCSADSECARSRYCNFATYTCQRRARVGATCTRDGTCRGRLRCLDGHCTRVPSRKEAVSECQTSADCGPGHCCARHKTRFTCKRLNPLGHRCINQPQYLPVPIYDICPCEAGTHCKYVHKPGEKWTLWAAYDNLRCVASDVERRR